MELRTVKRPPGITVARTTAGFDLTIGGRKAGPAFRFSGLQPGDVILRPFHISGNLVQKAKMRMLSWAIEHGERKGLGHALVFAGAGELGEGAVIHATPDAVNKNGMTLDTLDRQIGGLGGGEIHILRMSDDPAVRANALRFMRFHLWLAEKGRKIFSFHHPVSQPLPLPEPALFEEQVYRSYYQFSCVGAVLCAFGLQERSEELIGQYSAELDRQGDRILLKRHDTLNNLRVFLVNSPDRVFRTLRTMAPTGQLLRELAAGEIKPDEF